jgi:hypothetical protein
LETTDAIIRVKPGRMRNQWHHKGLAEYMTKKRFEELGLTEAAVGVRDRTFGTQIVEEADVKNKKKIVEDIAKPKKKDVVVMTVCTPPASQLLYFCFRMGSVMNFNARKAHPGSTSCGKWI